MLSNRDSDETGGGITMAKVDFKKQLKRLYQPSAKAYSVVDVPPQWSS